VALMAPIVARPQTPSTSNPDVARAVHFVPFTPFSSSHNDSDDSATQGGSRIAANSLDATAGFKMNATLCVR
jgi:hypothetical protein